MKAMELFPGAVCLLDGSPVVLNAVSSLWVTIGPGTMTLAYHRDELSPLPLSTAVLVGLGLEHKGLDYFGRVRVERMRDTYWVLENKNRVADAHQLQALALHLYGVELEWNQDAYEKAMKEEI